MSVDAVGPDFEASSRSARFGSLLRIAAILLGIASAVLMARSAFGIRFNEDFLLLLDIVRDIVGVVVLPFDLLIVTPVVRWLHEHGFAFELYPHWHNAFVLLWLFNASVSRAYARASPLSAADFPTLLRWIWAAFAALVGGVLAGTVALEQPAVLWWGVASFFLYRSGENLAYAVINRLWAVPGTLALAFATAFAALALGWDQRLTVTGHAALFWWPMAASFTYFASRGLIGARYRRTRIAGAALSWVAVLLAVLAGTFALGILKEPKWFSLEHSPSAGLASLAAFVVFLAAWYMFAALVSPNEGSGHYFERVFGNPWAHVALDVFAVLGIAAAIVYGAHLAA